MRLARLPFLLLLALALLPASAARAGLIAQYHLDTGTTVTDSGPNGLNATGSGTSVATGRFGAALRLAGTGDGFVVPGNEALKPAAITVAAWVRRGTTPGTFASVALGGDNECGGGTFSLNTGSGGGMQFEVIRTGTAGSFVTPAATQNQVWNGLWHAVAGTYDGSKARLYVDGALIGAVDAAGTLDYTRYPSGALFVGHANISACNGFDPLQYTGDLDEIQLYDRALNGTEIATLHAPGATTPPVIEDPGPTPTPSPSPSPGPGGETPTASPSPAVPTPEPEANVKRPFIGKVGQIDKDTYRYRCNVGTWTGLADNPQFTITWYQDTGFLGYDGTPLQPQTVGTGPTFDVDGRIRSGRKYLCRVQAYMRSGQRLSVPSVTSILRAFDAQEILLTPLAATGNVSVRGIDVFSVVQPEAGNAYDPYFKTYCGGGTPNPFAADCSGTAGAPREVDWHGSHLDASKPTSAVVYVNRDATVAATTQVEVVLRGGVEGGKFFDERLTQRVNTLQTAPNPWVTEGERGNTKMGVRFDLPADWLRAAAEENLNKLRLTAQVRIPPDAYPVVQCELLEGCGSDDVYDLRKIGVRDKSLYPLRIRSVQVQDVDEAKTRSAVTLKSPGQVLDRAMDTFPAGARYRVGAFTGTINLDLSALTGTSKDCGDAPDGETAGELVVRVRACRSGKVYDALWRYRQANPDGYDVLLGIHRYPGGPGALDEPGGSSGGPLLAGLPVSGRQPYIHVNDGSRGRPLTSAAHELGHALGAPHADFDNDPATRCGGNTPPETGEEWLPDNRGRLQGTKFDPDTGDRTPDLETSMLFDFMSYCASDANAWVSPRNWRRYEVMLTRLFHDPPDRRSARTTATTAQASTGTVTGTLIGGTAIINSVIPAGAAGGTPAAVPGSPLQVQSFDAAGAPLDTVGAQIDTLTDSSGATFFSAPLPASAAKVQVTAAGTVLAERSATKPPAVKVTAPRKGSRARRSLRVSWRATDPDGDALQATVGFSPSPGAPYKTLYEGVDTGAVTVPARQLQASRRARVRVTVNDGFNEVSAESARFRADGAPPTARIIVPARGVTGKAGGRTLLEGEATDDAGRALTGRRLTWFAGKRRLGTGSPLRARIPAGRVKLRLQARDRRGRRASATRVLVQEPVTLDLTELRAPDRVTRRTKRITVRIAATTPSRARIGGRTVRVGTKTRKVRVPLPRRPKSGLLKVAVKVTARGPKQPSITQTLLVFRL